MARKKSTGTATPTETEVEETSPVEPLFDDEDDDDDVPEATINADADEDHEGDDEQDEVEAALAAPSFSPTKYLKHFFTAEEVERFRVEREEKDATIDELQKEFDEKKEAASKLKKRIDVLQDEGMTLSRRIRNKAEMRNVQCEQRKEVDRRDDSPTKGEIVMVTYRLDTDEPIEWRVPTQRELFADGVAPTPPNGQTEIREAH